MRVLVTGAGGFIGRHVAKALAAEGWDVLANVNRHCPAELEDLPGVDAVRADLAGSQPLPFAGPCEAIVHCAAALPAAVPDEAELFRRNVEGMRRLLAFAQESGVRTILNCSSMAVFGRIDADLVTPDLPVVAPGAYGRSKLEGERMLSAYAAASGASTLSVRLPGVVGAGSHDNFLSNLVADIRQGRRVVARNPQALFNNIVHIDDLVGFFRDLLRTLPPGHRVATIAADAAMTISDIVAQLRAAAGHAAGVTYEEGGRPFLISPEPARALGYRVPTVEDSVRRLARDCLVGDAAVANGH